MPSPKDFRKKFKDFSKEPVAEELLEFLGESQTGQVNFIEKGDLMTFRMARLPIKLILAVLIVFYIAVTAAIYLSSNNLRFTILFACLAPICLGMVWLMLFLIDQADSKKGDLLVLDNRNKFIKSPYFCESIPFDEILYILLNKRYLRHGENQYRQLTAIIHCDERFRQIPLLCGAPIHHSYSNDPVNVIKKALGKKMIISDMGWSKSQQLLQPENH